MSEAEGAPETPQEQPSVTDDLEKIRAALARKQVHLPCPACGNSTWTFHTYPGLKAALMFVPEDGSFSIPPPHMPLYVFTCNRCGFVRPHLAAELDKP